MPFDNLHASGARRRACPSKTWLVLLGTLVFLSIFTNDEVLAQQNDSLLHRIAETYKNLGTYHFAGETDVRMRVGRQIRTASYSIETAERFPTHFYVDITGDEPMRFVADGKQSWAYDGALNEYLQRSWVLRPGKEREDIPDVFGAYKRLADQPVKMTPLGDTLYDVGGTTRLTRLIEVIPARSPGMQESISYRFWVDPQTYLVLREDLTRYIPNTPGGAMTVTQTTRYHIASVDEPVPDSLFRFDAPMSAEVVSDLDRFPGIPRSLHGQQAKSFLLNDLANDRPVVLDSLRGQVVVLNFWATWCGPCRAEMDALDKLQALWSERGLKVLAVNQEELPADVQPYIDQEGYRFDVLLDRFGLVSLQYEVDEIPTTFVIDREGVIREHLIGARTEDDFREAIWRWVE